MNLVKLRESTQETTVKIAISDLQVAHPMPGSGPKPILKHLDLEIADGEFVTIIGASGCGKSTLLNIIADPDAYRLRQGDVHISWKDPNKKNLGYVFQKDVLLPWKTVLQNVEVGLEIRGVPAKERRETARHWLHKVGLSQYENAFPHSLSGGMRQRVNIIRILAYDPEVILMDEPFGALDAQTRMNLQQQLLELWQETRKTILFITHDLEESVILGNRVVLLGGRPANAMSIYDVPFPFPRDIKSIRYDGVFQRLTQRIWEDLKAEIERWNSATP